MDDGSYVNVPIATTVFHPGDVIRITALPHTSGSLVLLEWDAANASWKKIYPPEPETVQVSPREPYVISVDIVLKAGERLRLLVDAVPSDIPIEIR